MARRTARQPAHHAARGPSQRQLRVGEVLRRALSDLLLRGDVPEPELASRPITVTEVKASPDLRHATVFVMPLGGAEAERTVAALQRCQGAVRRELAHRVDLKRTPELKFVLDETFDRLEDTRRLLGDDRVRRDLDAED